MNAKYSVVDKPASDNFILINKPDNPNQDVCMYVFFIISSRHLLAIAVVSDSIYPSRNTLEAGKYLKASIANRRPAHPWFLELLFHEVKLLITTHMKESLSYKFYTF